MATNIRIIQACDFIKVTAEGELDLQKTKELLMEIASSASPLGDFEIIVDTRKAQSRMSIGELWFLAAELSNHGKTFARKTAVLCPLEHFDHAGFFALCAQNRGFGIEAFTSFEDAIEWLTAEETWRVTRARARAR